MSASYLDEDALEKLTKALNGYYSTSFSPSEVERIFKSAFDPIEERIAALEEKKQPKKTSSNRDLYGRRKRRDASLF